MELKKEKKSNEQTTYTRYPNCNYSSENTVSRKQNEHHCLWNSFVPSSSLNTRLSNAGIRSGFSISVVQVLALLGKDSNGNQHVVCGQERILKQKLHLCASHHLISNVILP